MRLQEIVRIIVIRRYNYSSELILSRVLHIKKLIRPRQERTGHFVCGRVSLLLVNRALSLSLFCICFCIWLPGKPIFQDILVSDPRVSADSHRTNACPRNTPVNVHFHPQQSYNAPTLKCRSQRKSNRVPWTVKTLAMHGEGLLHVRRLLR